MRHFPIPLTLSRFTLLLAALGGAACDPASHPGYNGEVLASIHGLAAVKDPSYKPGPTEVVLLWAQGEAENFNMVAERVPVTGMFPAEFRLDLHQPPPSATTGFEAQGARLNLALIAAYKQGVLKTGEVLPLDDPMKAGKILSSWLGSAEELVIHLDRDLAADHPIAVLTGGIRTKGFHLVHLVPTPLAERQRRQQGCLLVFRGSPETCELDSLDDRDVAVVPGGFANHRIQIQIEAPLFTP